ncbi:cytochrome P450 4C1 isoform X2 [Tribolium castaneum]|uniref:cytochrome P450 4C1 isoform X2 n=1 Tax=Tribolium castaneum TaxID=7070 RepID=UPI0030FE2343
MVILDLWKKHRKNINPTFNTTILNTFIGAFAKQAEILVKNLEKYQSDEDIFPIVWKCTLDSACETLADVDPIFIDTEACLRRVFRIEEILLERFFNPLCHLNILWKFSPLRKELAVLWKQNSTFITQMIDIMKQSDNLDKKRFLNHLIPSHDLNYTIEEAQIMFFVGTETSGVAISSVLLILGMFPQIQEKIFIEIDQVFGSTTGSTLDEINHLDYLERVIKETLRLLPPIPFVMRSLDENLKLSCGTFPAGSRVIVPIMMVHRREDFWPEPLKFDPDRFLEERPSGTYIPFSYGTRNCLGYKYAMLSMKVILATILRKYRVKSSNYKSIDEVVLLIHIIAKATNGYKIVLEKRNK